MIWASNSQRFYQNKNVDDKLQIVGFTYVATLRAPYTVKLCSLTV